MENKNIDKFVDDILYENQMKKYHNKKDRKYKKYKISENTYGVIGGIISLFLFLLFMKGCFYNIKEQIKQQELLVKDGWEYIHLSGGFNKNNIIIDAEIRVRKLLDIRYGINNYYFSTTNISCCGQKYFDRRYWFKGIPKNK